MKFFFNKVLATIKNTHATEKTHLENVTEDIINTIEDKAFAISQQNVMYANTKELGGYYYLIVIVVGTFKIKTKKGGTLSISGKDFELELKTDMDEFESEYSNIPNRNITRIDFQIEEEDISKIDKLLIDSLLLKAKKHQLLFKTF